MPPSPTSGHSHAAPNPYVLTDQGLAAALAVAAGGASVSTTLAEPRRRYAAEIENDLCARGLCETPRRGEVDR
jgi:hypothetical protein